MKKIIVFLLVVLMIGSLSVADAAKPAFRLRFAHDQAADNPRNISAQYFAELVEKSSKGRVKVEIYHSGQLGGERELVEGMGVGGGADIVVAGSQFAAYAKPIQVIEMPYLFANLKQAHAVIDGKMGRILTEPLLKHNIHFLSFWENGFRHITSNKRPINVPNDLKGLKIRTPQSKMRQLTFSAFGASPISIGFSELYLSLNQGVVDAQENPLTNIYSARFYEVQKYLSLTGHIYSANLMCIQEKTWKKLPANLQKVIQTAANKASNHNREIIRKEAERLTKELAEKGMKVNTPASIAPFQEVAREKIWPLFEDELGKKLVQKMIQTAQQTAE
jgi:tripartite ATP-independent transporter DctP family solute receptor